MIAVKKEPETQQEPSYTEVSELDELREMVNEIPDGTILSIDLEVIELGQET